MNQRHICTRMLCPAAGAAVGSLSGFVQEGAKPERRARTEMNRM